ncbi:hypothetical protein, partial [Xylella fastidiosa]|uniref:hypothetical protein n=1 Tax=Xylella fastidiosa TaxID=2371 RepID=UPI001396B086
VGGQPQPGIAQIGLDGLRAAGHLGLAAHDLLVRQTEFNDTNQAETTLRREHDDVTTRLEVATVELAAHESAVTELTERAEAAQQTWFRLS